MNNRIIMDFNEFEEDTQKGKYLTFNMGEEIYGIEIKYVTEIIGVQSITEVPELPDFIKGIINLRGMIISVIDVRLRFKKEEIEYNDRTCIVVVEIGNLSIGLIVDGVAEVVEILEEDLVDPPSMKGGFSNKYIKNIGKVGDEVKLLLDCEKLLTVEEVEELNTSI